MDHSSKRRRLERSPSPDPIDEDNYVPYVSFARRRQEKLAKLAIHGSNPDRERSRRQQELEEREDELKEDELRKERERRERTLLVEAQEVHSRKAVEGVQYCLAPSNPASAWRQMQRRP